MSVLWILGDAKSGKSELAEEIFHRLPGRKLYIGTLPKTLENAETIRKHDERRPRDWGLIEVTGDLSVATRAIGRHGPTAPAVLLDGFGVYVQERARRWETDRPGLTIEAEAPFVGMLCTEYLALARVCGYLIVVDHVTADPPAPADYPLDPGRWRLREVVTRCQSAADHVIYHDRTDVTHADTGFVEEVAARLIARHTK